MYHNILFFFVQNKSSPLNSLEKMKIIIRVLVKIVVDDQFDLNAQNCLGWSEELPHRYPTCLLLNWEKKKSYDIDLWRGMWCPSNVRETF